MSARGPPVFPPEVAAVDCVENEDLDTWPSVSVICHSGCRSEWLWRCTGVPAADCEVVANGSSYWSSLGWEVRQNINAFIEVGESTLGDIFPIT
jgi:hypothetical protein